MKPNKILFDTDVIVNWLTKETETVTGRDLWTAPYKIIKHKEFLEISKKFINAYTPEDFLSANPL